MSWGVDRATLEAGRDEAANEVAANPCSRALERLGRAHLWLDELEPAAACFREAAQDVERRVEAGGRGDAASRGQTGTLLRLAGEHAAAAQWFARALEDTREDAILDMAAYCYLLDDQQAALAAAARALKRRPLLEIVEALARGRAEQAPDMAVAAREHAIRVIRAERTPPYEESGGPHLSLFDWLEEAFVVEAQLRGEAVCDHVTMLERAGLVSPEEGRQRRRRRPLDLLPAPGRVTLVRITPDGAPVEASLEVTDPGGLTTLVLDPREGIELTVLLLMQFGEFIVRIQEGEYGESEDDLDDTYDDFRSACTAAADWLRAYAPDPPGGAWAADTIDALVAASVR
ncbi:MAG: hypothetical protein MSC31_18045 [Solirubrobacteraceae bacterium MAG38_C4-C5]|nr:hypothetical protein [Candidatus Siliceabacter maunaloa]